MELAAFEDPKMPQRLIIHGENVVSMLACSLRSNHYLSTGLRDFGHNQSHFALKKVLLLKKYSRVF